MNAFKPLVMAIAVFACLIFLVGVFKAGQISRACNPADSGQAYSIGVAPDADRCVQKPPEHKGEVPSDPFLTNWITGLAGTLATFFGAAVGATIATGKSPNSGKNRPIFMRWAGFGDEDRYAIIQTIAGYVYIFGMMMALYYFVADKGWLDTPYTHPVIKACGTQAVGLIGALFAMVLGVKSSTSLKRK